MTKNPTQSKKATKSSKRTKSPAQPDEEADTATTSTTVEAPQATPAIPEVEVAVESQFATLSDEELGGIAVVEPNWNEHVMQVEAGETVNYTCRLTFDPYKQEVESFEVESVT